MNLLETHTRTIQVNVLKTCIKSADFSPEAGISPQDQGRDIERNLNELNSMNAVAEVKEMLEYLIQILLIEPQTKIEAAVRSPDPTTYRRIVSLNLELLKSARFIPSVSSTQQITYELVLQDLKRTEQSKLEGHCKNARSSISARLKEFRSDCQNPVDLSSELKSAFMKPLFPCLAGIYAHLKYPSASNLLQDLNEANLHLDSVNTIYTPEASQYPIFSEFKQLLSDVRQDGIKIVEHFEVICTTKIEFEKLFKK